MIAVSAKSRQHGHRTDGDAVGVNDRRNTAREALHRYAQHMGTGGEEGFSVTPLSTPLNPAGPAYTTLFRMGTPSTVMKNMPWTSVPQRINAPLRSLFVDKCPALGVTMVSFKLVSCPCTTIVAGKPTPGPSMTTVEEGTAAHLRGAAVLA